MTVLILAPERDPTADRMVRELRHRDVSTVRLDTAWFPQHADLDAELRDGQWTGTLRVRDRGTALRELRSIWYRSPSAFDFPDDLSPVERQWAMNEAKLGLGGVLGALPVVWLNHPARIADASVKPVQLVTARRCGLTVPDTLITNRADAVRRFAAAGATFGKAIGAPSIVEASGRATAFTHLLDDSDLDDLRGVEVTTPQYQRWVPKSDEARVIVVGPHVFAAGIHAGTEQTRGDWRNSYADLAYSRPDLPEPVRVAILRYCRELDLLYGAFDFVVRPDGTWVFLECNAGDSSGGSRTRSEPRSRWP